MKEEVSKEMKEGILQRMTSPWFFTFLPWWVVFNYDFLLFAIGSGDIVRDMASHYCTKDLYSTLEHFTIFGCAQPHTTFGSLLWFRFLLPILATVVSMTIIAWFISWITDLYHKMSHKEYRYEWYCKYIDKKYWKNSKDVYGNTVYGGKLFEDKIAIVKKLFPKESRISKILTTISRNNRFK
jgi:hypothetical protein